MVALLTALEQDNKVLVFNDGVRNIINNTVKVVDVQTPVEWGQYILNYTITFEFIDTSPAHNISLTASIGSFTFPQPPNIGSQYHFERKSRQANPTYIKCRVSITGIFLEGSVNANQAKLVELQVAVVSGSATLIYGALNQTVRIIDISAPEAWTADVLPYSLTCEYDLPAAGSYPGDIIDFKTRQQYSLVYKRTAFHEIPYEDGRITQDLGLSHYTITFSGFFIGVTLADALAAFEAEVATRPAGGILMQGGTYNPDAETNRFDYSSTYSYNSAAAVQAALDVR
jgi:hypothetical protein